MEDNVANVPGSNAHRVDLKNDRNDRLIQSFRDNLKLLKLF